MEFINSFKLARDRVLQFVALSHIFVTFFLGPLISLILCAYIYFFTSLYPLLLAYLIWIYIDRGTCKKGGRRLRFLRNTGLWKYYKDYFPLDIVKTVDLSPKSNYIFCFFPHGIVCAGAFSLTAWEDSEFFKQFPGLTISCHTLNINFYIPFSREYALGLGFVSVSRDSILYHLSKPCGNAVGLIVGGSAEAMRSSPGTHKVVLKKRQGFIKLALATGTPLVPIYVFGEVDLYDQTIYPINSFKRRAQELFRKITGVAPCNVRGSGLFGLLPKRVPITTVVGKPIQVQQIQQPTQDQVNELHEKFIRELVNLFDEHKEKYIQNSESAHLNIE